MSVLRNFTTYRAGVLQSRAHRKLESFISKRLKEHSLTMMEWAMLGTIHDAGRKGITMSKLARILDVNISHITNKSEEFIERGLVEKKINEQDKRVKFLIATDECREKVQRVEKSLRKEMRAWMRGVNKTSLYAYIKTLEAITELDDN